MLPKKMRPKQVVAFRPIANIRLFYKVFACLVLDRIEHQLDDHRPEEQHGIRRGKRIEEHLLTANVFLDKALFFYSRDDSNGREGHSDVRYLRINPNLGKDNSSPICSPNGAFAAEAAFAPRVATAKLFVLTQ